MNGKYLTVCKSTPDELTSELNKIVEKNKGEVNVDFFDFEYGPAGTGIEYCALLNNKGR